MSGYRLRRSSSARSINNKPTDEAMDDEVWISQATERRRSVARRVYMRTSFGGRKNPVFRMSRSHEYLDELDSDENFEHGAAGPRCSYEPVRNDVGDRKFFPKRRRLSRKQSRKLSSTPVALTRSLESMLDLPDPESILPSECAVRWRSLPSLSDEISTNEQQVGDFLAEERVHLRDYSVNAYPVEERASMVLVTEQSEEQCFGHMEMETGVKALTCKCQSEKACSHNSSWMGVITEKWRMRFYRVTSQVWYFIRTPPETTCISEQDMKEKISKMTQTVVFSDPDS